MLKLNIPIFQLDCANEIVVDKVNFLQSFREGLYTQDGTIFNGKPVYRNEDEGQVLYYNSNSNFGWSIGPSTSEYGLMSQVSS